MEISTIGLDIGKSWFHAEDQPHSFSTIFESRGEDLHGESGDCIS